MLQYAESPRSQMLYVNPTYLVRLPTPSRGSRLRTESRLKNEENLKNNSQEGVLSIKARRKLMNAVNWLVASASRKWIFDKSTGKRFSFKLNFVTLTLPALDHGISDHTFKAVLLHAFINQCRYKYGLKNFVWKVETQANGNIHAHFTTDCFIHWKDLRRTWNKILSKHGVISLYQEKHSALSFSEYCTLYSQAGNVDLQTLRKAFDYGTSSGWSDPNSTDVKAVYKVDDVAAYLAKYMSKNEDDRRKISGRLWGCSYSLSYSNRLSIEQVENIDEDLTFDFSNPEIKHIELTRPDAVLNIQKPLGDLFLYKLNDWGRIIKGRLLDVYNEHRRKIRLGLEGFDYSNSVPGEISPPIHLSLVPVVLPQVQPLLISNF